MVSSLKGQQPTEIQNKIKMYINANPQLFTVISVLGGHGGNLVLRILAGTDNKWLWSKYMAMSRELDSNSKPLDWPRNTEGYLTYDMVGWEEVRGSRTWSSYFKENHLASAHTGITNIENTTESRFNTFITDANNYNKKILIRSHNLDIHKELPNVEVIRIYGNLNKILVRSRPQYYIRNFYNIEPINATNVYNLNIGNLISREYNIFVEEYLQLCEYFNIYPNISNIRAYILNWIERLDRVTNYT
jgi:hypothetical protein